MGWLERLRAQPLRTKLIITAVGTAVLVFGVASSLTFRYWRQQSQAAAEQQALLAAASVRSSLEAAISAGMTGRARGALRELAELASITGARVYGTDGTILVSTDRSEEGIRPVGVWIPTPRDLPDRGTARPTPEGDAVNAFLPIKAGGTSILEVDFSLHELEEAMDRAARLGLLLLIGSVAAVILIVATMLEREVVTPIERMVGILGPKESSGRGSGELERIEEGMTHLLRKEQEAEARAAEQEQRLAKQAGFAQVGEMAAEMAHEFKRPLASIRSAVSLLEQEYELNEQAQTLLAAVDGQLGRLTETMQDLFALAKPVEMPSEQVDLREAVDQALANLSSLTDTTGRTVERDYERDLPPVYGDQHRIEQAVQNVMLNAMEAMEAGGRLRVRLRRRGETVVARFEDTGPGIPEEEIERIVLPFYSTKPSGTGLGLPLVARVMAAHGGALDIWSEHGRGTTVELVIPVRQVSASTASEGEWQANGS
jgi:signal transduction histidine kinase